MGTFINTWSVEGFVSEGLQPAELGWGTHEKWLPKNAVKHGARLAGGDLPDAARRQHAPAQLVPDAGRRNTASLSRITRQSRSPTFSPCATGGHAGPTAPPAIMPTTPLKRCHAVDARDVRRRRLGAGRTTSSTRTKSWTASDELGVLLYGHDKNAYWYGSQLDIERDAQARAVPERHRHAGDLRGAAPAWSGRWRTRSAGIVETDEMDFRCCLEVQTPYLGPVQAAITRTGHRSKTARACSPRISIQRDPWQFQEHPLPHVRLTENQNGADCIGGLVRRRFRGFRIVVREIRLAVAVSPR